MRNGKSPLLSYLISGLVVGILSIVSALVLPKDSFAYSFMFNGWPVQVLNCWLFLVGIVFWVQRYSLFKSEEVAFDKIQMPQDSIPRDRVQKLIESMPEDYKNTLTLRRFREILQAFLYGEDIIRLNEELSRRDMGGVERGHLILSSLTHIIPVIGFLGTVVGLSMGMIVFPKMGDASALRIALGDFATSLSVAFNTTLLALGFTVALILLTSFLRQREEALVSRVDERARVLVGKIKADVVTPAVQPEGGAEQIGKILDDALMRWKEVIASSMQELTERLSSENKQFAGQFEGFIKEAGNFLGQKFDELKEGIRRPPRYQIIVQPLEENKDEE